MRQRFQIPAAVFALLAALLTAPIHAQTCPFDNGGSSLEVEGLILTRYALGLTGAPLVANTSINAVDAPTVEASINCPSCGLNITGNPTLTVADATIISRKLAGFSGADLTNNLALGSGTRNTPAAVQSFLLAGCGATGGTVTSITAGTGLTGGTITGSGTFAVNTAVIQSRVSATCAVGSSIRAISADGSVTCQTDSTGGSGTVTSVATGAGLTGGPISTTGTIGLTANQLLPTTACASGQIAKWNGSAWACAADDAGPANAFVQGGNTFSSLGAGVASMLGNNDNRPLTVQAPQSTIKLLVDSANGDDGLRISYATDGFRTSPNTINGSKWNSVAAGVVGATIGGGGDTQPGPVPNSVNANFGTVGGGAGNSVVGSYGVVGGGTKHTANGFYSVVPGGYANSAAGDYSFAAGRSVRALHDGAFVWGDSQNVSYLDSTGADQFVIRAGGGVILNTPSVKFGPTANVHAAGGEESLRITRGLCNCIIPTPTISVGSGVTVTRTAVGKFTFTFTTPFTGLPIVTLTIFAPGGAGYTTVLSGFTPTGFNAETYQGATLADATLSFIAVGPR